MLPVQSRFDPRLFVMDVATSRIQFSKAGHQHYAAVFAPLGLPVARIRTLPDLVHAFRQLRQVELHGLVDTHGQLPFPLPRVPRVPS